MKGPEQRARRLAVARFRFGVISPLLTSPPESGDLRARIEELCRASYEHPLTKQPLRLGFSTIERWLYQARKHPDDPVAALARKQDARVGQRRTISPQLMNVLLAQYKEHPSWTMLLHHKNLRAQCEKDPALGAAPSYATLCRFLKARGWLRKKKYQRGKQGFASRETRSFEVEHVLALVHADFHEGSRRVLLADGSWQTPVLFGCLDDRSRLCLHLQWYLAESTESFVHGICQAILKRGLFRALLTDNGKAMLAGEVSEGLSRLGVIHHTTLPYSPQQNGKQESFWGKIEGQLLPMLEGHKELTLQELNHFTQAYVEKDYHRSIHRELQEAPLAVFCTAAHVIRKAPSAKELRRRFRTEMVRNQRQSDGTITVAGVRFEVPAAYRHWPRLCVQVARWDLSAIGLVDPHSGKHLAELYPLDKRQNASGKRKALDRTLHEEPPQIPASGVAPYLRSLLSQYDQSHIAAAYLPHHGEADQQSDDPHDQESCDAS